MTTTMFLGFLQNRQSKEEFVAPVMTDDLAVAKAELARTYPESRYILQTIYSRAELEHVLKSVDRWPGLPSKVQPPLTTDLSKVSAQVGGLPPLPGQVQAALPAQATSATIQQVQGGVTNQGAMPGWMQSYVQSQMAKAPAPQKPVEVVQALSQMMAEQKPAAAPQSLIERLKMAKGETMSSVGRAPVPSMPAAVVQPAKAGSVIDILKGMRK